MCLWGEGRESETRGAYCKRLWESASLDLMRASLESVFAFERLYFHTASPVGTVINADVNGEI